MGARELSHSRCGGGRESSKTSVDYAGSASLIDSENLVAQADVASLVAAPDQTDASTQNVAGQLSGVPDPEQSTIPPDVKSLIAADSPAADLTGAVETSPAISAPATRRRFRPHVRRPRIGRVHMPVRVRTFDSFGYQSYVVPLAGYGIFVGRILAATGRCRVAGLRSHGVGLLDEPRPGHGRTPNPACWPHRWSAC